MKLKLNFDVIMMFIKALPQIILNCARYIQLKKQELKAERARRRAFPGNWGRRNPEYCSL